jgi:hypothetical protein
MRWEKFKSPHLGGLEGQGGGLCGVRLCREWTVKLNKKGRHLICQLHMTK